MTLTEYQKAVIELFQSGKANDYHYLEMARAVAAASDKELVPAIDGAIGVDDEGWSLCTQSR